MKLMSSIKDIGHQIGLMAFLLAIYPAVIAYVISGNHAIFSSFHGDTFYYLAIAKNHDWSPLFSFDSILPTNGFHPLWQWFLKLSFQIPSMQENMTWQLHYTFIVSTLCIGLAAILLANSVYMLTQSTSLSLLAVVPGFLYWLLSPLTPIYGAYWSFNNGMESPFSLLFFSCFIYYSISRDVFLKESLFHYFVLSVFLTLIVLARLDDIFLLPMVVIAIFYANQFRLLDGLKKSLAISAFPVICILGYLVMNYSYAGTAMPISGVEKNGFSLHWMIGQAMDSIFPILQLATNKWDFWDQLTMRAFQNLIPPLIAIVWLIHFFHGRKKEDLRTNSQILLACLCAYVVLKGAYNAFFVFIWHQGPWYYPISTVIVNILMAVLLKKVISLSDEPRISSLLCGKVAIVLLVLFSANCFTYQKDKNYFNQNYLLWINRDRIDQEVLAGYQGKGILSFDDGILAYSLNRPVMSGFGFALDFEGSKAKRSGRLFQLAYDRGFRLMGPNIGYGPELPDAIGLDASEQIMKANYAIGQDLGGWVFSIKYIDPVTKFKFVEFYPKGDR